MGRESTGHIPFCFSALLSICPVTAELWVGPTRCGNSSLLPTAPCRAGLYFCSPFPPSHSLRTHTAGGDLGGQRIRPGISAGSPGPQWAGEMLATLPSDPLPSQWSPPFPTLGVGSLPLPQLPLRGTVPVPPPLLLTAHCFPHPTWSLGVPPIPLGVRGSPTSAW